MNRRNFIHRSATAAAALALPSCSKKPSSTLNVYTWVDYLNPDVAERFEKEFSCKLVIDTFDANETMLAKLKAGATGYDVLVPTSYAVKALDRDGFLQPLDHSKLPNISNIDSAWLKTALDPEMKHSIPYMSAPTGLAYLTSKVTNPVASWKMLEREDLRGRMTLLNDMRETLGAALKSLGYKLNSVDPGELAKARDVVVGWKKNIAKFENEQYKTGIASGEFHLVHGYAGDIAQVMEENEDIVFALPEEGAPFSADDLCIFKSSQKSELAHQFINFLTDPEVAAENMEWIGYRAPNSTAYRFLSEDFRGFAALFPPDEVYAKCEPIDDIGDSLKLWSDMWDAVKSS
jgi:spermidine/putrescine transport system substrate-binding protein